MSFSPETEVSSTVVIEQDLLPVEIGVIAAFSLPMLLFVNSVNKENFHF